ncbi:MAG: AIPR family protein [Muribaculaceae bacterium]|nr:AIPR family protein [Muribaculaceae bacterium]
MRRNIFIPTTRQAPSSCPRQCRGSGRSQTTTLIGKYKGDNSQDFYIPCKIVAAKSDSRADIFFTKIAEATNSQKPILARDLKSNSPEMVSLYNWLKNKGIYLEIKRGFKPKF